MADLISGMAKAECDSCKAVATKPIIAARGTFDPSGIGLEHEDWCGFFKAIKSSRATAKAWVEKNGYPVKYSIDGKPIPVAHPGGDGWQVSK